MNGARVSDRKLEWSIAGLNQALPIAKSVDELRISAAEQSTKFTFPEDEDEFEIEDLFD